MNDYSDNVGGLVSDFLNTFNRNSLGSGNAFFGVTMGIVVETDDPLQMGRLRVFCPALNDDPKQLQYVPWSVYATPFAGSINNSSYTRGSDPEHTNTEGATHYGFWAIPELGAHVLVSCVDGDYRRRVWMGCVPQHLETNTMHGGRWLWENGTVEGPLSSSGKPIEPQYTNAKEAFDNKKDSPEWKTRVADYQASAIRDDFGQTPNSKKKYKDQTNKSIIENEPQEWTHDALGAHGYDWTGFKNMGALLSSRTFGFSSPGMHSLIMDDRPFNSRMKLKTTSGHVIILDDTNERIYIATNKGKSWLEMDSNGNIDMFSENRVSIHAAQDLNLSASESVRIYAGDSINLYAGHANIPIGGGGELLVDEPLPSGVINIQAESDISTVSNNLRMLTNENVYLESGLNLYQKIGDSVISTAVRDYNVSTVNGDHIVSSGNNIFSTSKVLTKCYSEGTMSMASDGDYEAQSFNGTSSVSANQSVRIKSANSNVDMEAGMSSGRGSVNSYAPGAQHSVGDQGVTTVSSNNITTVSGSEIANAVQPGATIDNANAASTVLASANVNISKITGTDISMNSAFGDILQKTTRRGHSYNKIGDQIDMLTAGLNTLTMQTGQFYQAAQAAIGALSGSLSVDFSFDIGCAMGQLFDLLPQELLDAYATYEDIKRALEDLGYVVEDLQSVLQLLQNGSILDALGLPDLDINVSIGSSSCTPGMPKLTDIIDYDVPQLQTPEHLRELIKGIFDAGSQLGTAPPLTVLNLGKSYPH